LYARTKRRVYLYGFRNYLSRTRIQEIQLNTLHRELLHGTRKDRMKDSYLVVLKPA
jgi:hypothetical protein